MGTVHPLTHYILIDMDADRIIDGGVDLASFFAANSFDDGERNDVLRLKVGDDYMMGGGAAPFFVLRRVA
jgi:hypothetical protein